MTRDRQDTPNPDRRTGQPAREPAAADRRAPMAPGDEAPAGTPGTGETVCRACGGRGKVDGRTCPECQGSGKVIAGIGGA